MAKRWVTVQQFFDERRDALGLQLIAGEEGLARRRITASMASAAGLHLTGFAKSLKEERVIVFSEAEMSYLRSLPAAQGRERIGAFFRHPHACVVVTQKQKVPGAVKEAAQAHQLPLLLSPKSNAEFFDTANRYLSDKLAETISLHGVLIDVFGTGVLLRGESGIGKSETALDLIMRGHRLVADDIVEIQRVPPNALLGRGAELIKHHMEIRGLGIINVRDLFGIASIRDRKRIELICHLIDWQSMQDYDRLGLEEENYTVLDVSVPYLRIPVRPGRNLAVIVEIAARNHLLKRMGHHSAQQFQRRLLERLESFGRSGSADGDEVE